MAKIVEFFFSPGSRYSYLAASQLPALKRECDCTVLWKPVHGPDIRALRGRDPFVGPPPSGQYEWSYRETDAEAWADLYGIPFHEPCSHEFDSRLLVRASAASRELDRVAEYSWELSLEVYGRRAWPIDEALCVRVAHAIGLDSSRFAELLRSPRIEQAIESSAREAYARGVFGVPTFFVDTQMYWGNDRLPLVRHALRRVSS